MSSPAMAQLRPNTQLRRSLNRIGEAIRQMKATVITMNVTEAETGTARAAAGGGAGAGVDFVADEVAVVDEAVAEADTISLVCPY